MPMRLYLLRHAEAEDSQPDESRNLTLRGRHTVRALAGFLEDRDAIDVERVWHSPLVRARQTAEEFVKGLDLDLPLQVHEALLPESDPLEIAAQLHDLKDDVLLVGHNPHMEMLASLLISGRRYGAGIQMKKCSLLALEKTPYRASSEGGSWLLRWQLPPRLYR